MGRNTSVDAIIATWLRGDAAQRSESCITYHVSFLKERIQNFILSQTNGTSRRCLTQRVNGIKSSGATKAENTSQPR